jgi:hypothetical protein
VVILVPAVASLSLLWGHLGAFDTPFEPPQVAAFTNALLDSPQVAEALLPRLEEGQLGAPDLMATETAALAAPTIYVSGQEVLPIGGFTGTIPEPSLSSIEAMVGAGDFHIVLQSAGATDPRFLWISTHCHELDRLAGSARSPTGPLVVLPLWARALSSRVGDCRRRRPRSVSERLSHSQVFTHTSAGGPVV